MTPLPDSPKVVIYQPVGAVTTMVASNISSELEVIVVHNKNAYNQACLGLPFKQDVKCSVPDCELPAIGQALISIHNAPKADVPLCQYHLDTAKEDFRDVPQTQGSFNRTC